MDRQEDTVAILSSACRLPLGITNPSQLWEAFCHGNSRDSFTSLDSVPDTRRSGLRHLFDSGKVGGAGWLGKEGVEAFDPSFFNISPAEAEVLRPNARLALELTWEALERAGIPPSSVRGENVALSIGMGTEDGWDLQRFSEDGPGAFDHRWATNSDPSGVSGQVAHFFDFRGPCSVISTACSSGAFALRDGIQALIHEECDLAVVGAITTHFSPAPFGWASSVNVASKKGQCAAFSSEADGYIPCEGAVFFILKKFTVDQTSANPILGVIRSLSTGHNGSTRALATPNVSAQTALTRRSLRAAHLSPSDVDILEAHGTGTRLGDAIEAEAFRDVYDSDNERRSPLWVSSSKTLFGHCQAPAMLVGILKVLACFEHKSLPPHLFDPVEEFKKGQILIPTALTPLPTDRPVIAQVSSFGFTGSISSLILEEARLQPTLRDTAGESVDSDIRPYFLPFSAKTRSALDAQIKAVFEWACQTRCNLYDLGAILALCRDHHPARVGIIASDIHELRDVSSETYSPKLDDAHGDESFGPTTSAFLNLPGMSTSLSEEDRRTLDDLVGKNHILNAACFLYNKDHNLHFEEVYDLRNVSQLLSYLQTFPTYAFDRKICWRSVSSSAHLVASPIGVIREPKSVQNPSPQRPSISLISETVASILHIPVNDVHPSSNIFDLGVDSLNSIELASTLSQAFGISLPGLELYSLLTVQSIYDYFSEKRSEEREPSIKDGPTGTNTQTQKQFSQADVDSWVAKYGASLVSSLTLATKEERTSNALSVLLTGANGMLGCHLLHTLLSKAEIARVFCLVRGDAWDRIPQAYTKHGYDQRQLAIERDAGRLVVFRTSDLGDEYLGCGKDVYEKLLVNIDTVVHLAWKLDFNLPAPAFRNCIEGTRRLAQLCAETRKQAVYYFISSFSSYFGYKDELIPEQPLTANLAASLDQGYAISKLIAEHSLFSILRSSWSSGNAGFDLRVVRVGQICGNSVTGDWSLNEMKPMMIQALPTLKMLARNMPDVSWIPSDICAATISDFVLSPASTAKTDVLRVLHVANPKITPWTKVVDMLTRLAGLGNIPLVSLKEYEAAVRSAAKVSELPITRLLPYFRGVIEKEGDFPPKYASLEIKESLAYSDALASCPEVDEEFLIPIVKSLLGKDVGSPESPLGFKSLDPPVLLFGPWSESVSSPAKWYGEIEERVQAAATRTRNDIGYIDANKPLDYQLATLISQLTAFEELKRRSVVPRAVLGYCFGEYTASVCAGILTLETAVDIIVRRAAALHDIKGSMLNVFAELNVVRRQLLKLPFILEVAIHAGPKHYVISGPPDEVASAQSAFQKAGVKTKLVETSIPFHSSLMDHTIKNLILPSFTCKEELCVYVSGLTGRAIGGKRLGPKYWLRHMRVPVLFVDGVRHLRERFPESPLVDVGPGRMLSSIVARYGWEGCRITALDKFLSGELLPVREPSEVGYVPPRKTVLVSKPAIQPVEQTPTTSPAEGKKTGRDEAETVLTNILVANFGFKKAESQTLLTKSFVMLGLQSLDFISFSEKVVGETGLVIPPSAFASELTLAEILNLLVN